MPKPIQPKKPKVTIDHIHKHLLDISETLYSIKTGLEDNLAKIGTDLNHILKNQKMAGEKTTQALIDLGAIKDQLTKIGTESAATLQKVTDLEAAATAADVPQEVLDAIAAVKTQAQVVDDLVPDAETPAA